ncbi:anti-sigma B factor antagonist [Streptomyces sp. TLI_053]|uniref:STAS domain-containing protein n=1 Tax=Streptomyces sp. TLI_053 TaxID=1855352 RepID=UPI000879F039|nr:STAS domain-containing protein [Streptomyces sp. TLI_053]SDT82835.1 anti-sigma B factor antagonist [Streptomyces sp. TLI_053]
MTRRPPRPPPGAVTAAPDQSVGLTVRTRLSALGTVLSLHGELDLDTVAVLREALDRAPATPGTVLLVDCGDLAFCDSTGLSALLDAAVGARERKTRIELARLRPIVRRVLELTGAIDAFTLRESLPP